MTDLEVELYGLGLGTLSEAGGTFDFRVHPEALTRYGTGSRVLSQAVPLSSRPRRADARIRRNFFDELLPEGRARTRLAGNARLAPDYTIGMLARYGRDVAGALAIYDPTSPEEPRTPGLRHLGTDQVGEILREVARAPLGNTTAHRMSSLAGVQDKIVLAKDGATWAEPLDGFPSTHIVKPVVPTHPSLIFDEEYGARIARHLGLLAYETSIETFGDITALVIERYDRSPDAPGHRLHQEDFNQALGMTGDGKYQDEGHPGLAAIAKVVRSADRESLPRLLRMVTLSIAVGNLDMHAKNISLLRLPDGTARLAPAYDVVPQLHQPVEPVVALYVNGVREHAAIRLDDLVAEGRTWGVEDAELVVRDTLERIAGFVDGEKQHPGAHHSLQDDVRRVTGRLLDGERAGGGDGSSPAAPAALDPTAAPVFVRPPEAPGGWGGPQRR